MQDRDLANRLRELMARESLTQAALAKLAKVSQASVSRALRSEAIRHGRAWRGLFSYIRQEGSPGDDTPTGRDQVLAAFTQIWDGTEAHAAAVAKIIEATEGLGPASKEKTRGDTGDGS